MSVTIDHLIFAVPDLQDGIKQLEALLGVTAIAGGSHPGLGTCNAILSLGPQCYLEIMGPDPEQSEFKGTRPFGIDSLESGQLVAWVARRQGLEQFVETVKAKGIALRDVVQVSRATPEGGLLEWEMTYLTNEPAEIMSVMPLFIDWGKTPHPESRCEKGATLVSLEIEYPERSEIMPFIETFELDVNVCEGSTPRLRAMIDCPRGKVELATPR